MEDKTKLMISDLIGLEMSEDIRDNGYYKNSIEVASDGYSIQKMGSVVILRHHTPFLLSSLILPEYISVCSHTACIMAS